MRPVNSEHQILSGRRKRVKNIKHVRLFNLLGRGPALCGSTSHVSRAGKFYTICYEIISRTLDRVERVQRYRDTFLLPRKYRERRDEIDFRESRSARTKIGRARREDNFHTRDETKC